MKRKSGFFLFAFLPGAAGALALSFCFFTFSICAQQASNLTVGLSKPEYPAKRFTIGLGKSLDLNPIIFAKWKKPPEALGAVYKDEEKRLIVNPIEPGFFDLGIAEFKGETGKIIIEVSPPPFPESIVLLIGEEKRFWGKVQAAFTDIVTSQTPEAVSFVADGKSLILSAKKIGKATLKLVGMDIPEKLLVTVVAPDEYKELSPSRDEGSGD